MNNWRHRNITFASRNVKNTVQERKRCSSERTIADIRFFTYCNLGHVYISQTQNIHRIHANSLKAQTLFLGKHENEI